MKGGLEGGAPRYARITGTLIIIKAGGNKSRVGRHFVAPMMVGGERTTCASTASSLNLRRANARRPLTHSLTSTNEWR
jgi:hypothetical protein